MGWPGDILHRTHETDDTATNARLPRCPRTVEIEQPAVEDRWCSSKEAARYLGISPTTLSTWRMKGAGPRYSATLGRDPRYRLSELAGFMEAGLVANTVQAKKKRAMR